MRHTAKRHVQQQRNQHERHRDNQGQALSGSLHELVLAGEGQRITRRQFDLWQPRLFRRRHIGAKVAVGNVDKGPADRLPGFALDHPRTIGDVHRGNVAQRDVIAACGDNRQLSNPRDPIAPVAGVTQIDRVALQAFNRLRDVDTADRRAHHVLHVVDVEAQPRGLVAVDINIDGTPAHHALG